MFEPLPGVSLGGLNPVNDVQLMPLLGSPHPLVDVVNILAMAGIMLFALFRIGLLAFIAAGCFTGFTWQITTLDSGAWTGPSTMVNAVFALSIAAYAAYVALGGRSLLGDPVLEDSR